MKFVEDFWQLFQMFLIDDQIQTQFTIKMEKNTINYKPTDLFKERKVQLTANVKFFLFLNNALAQLFVIIIFVCFKNNKNFCLWPQNVLN